MKDNKIITCLGWIVLAVASIVVGAFMNGYVLSVLWRWFVVPVFNVPSLSIATAIGLSLVIGMLISQKNSSSKEKKETSDLIIEIISIAVFAPLFTLFLGWIVKLFL